MSPLELVGDADGHVSTIRLVKNRLLQTTTGSIASEPTDYVEQLKTGLVFRAVGYRGVALPGVPMNERWGVILNRQGRVIEPGTQRPVVGEYCAGWIKRGPSGVIGTNKMDAEETVLGMLEDVAQGSMLQPSEPAASSAESLVRERQPRYLSWSDWLRLDEIEVERGRAQGRPRNKFTRIEDMLTALSG